MSEKNKFIVSIITSAVLDENYLNKCGDYWEKYDENKEYVVDEYEYDYGKGMKNYLNVSYAESFKSKDKYVVAQEEYSESELRELEPYCSCYKCSLWFFNPSKYLTCSCCVGCIRAGPDYARKTIVDKAREALAESKKK